MCEPDETDGDIITEGQYVIVKKTNKFKKLYKAVPNGILKLAKNEVQMHEIIGKRFWTTFVLVPVKGLARTFRATEVSEKESLNDLLNQLPSGSDNRSIMDDGTSQKLSTEEILQLQESGKSGKEIVGSLIQNNKSFLDKTEYSQEKYLKKKEQKYLKYVTICKPTISLLHDSFFTIDHTKILHLRMDILAQFLSYSDVQSDGLYILYDSGSSGLLTAAMLNRIGANTNGRLISLYPGFMPSQGIVHGMNFPVEQLLRLTYVNIQSLLKLYYHGESAVWQMQVPHHKKKKFLTQPNPKKFKAANAAEQPLDTNNIPSDTNNIPSDTNNISLDTTNLISDNTNKSFHSTNTPLDTPSEAIVDIACPVDTTVSKDLNGSSDTVPVLSDTTVEPSTVIKENIIVSGVKRRRSDSDKDESDTPKLPRKPQWLIKANKAVEHMQTTKARGLAIAASEHPENIVTALLPFLGASRPFVIYHVHKEPLQETYMTLKRKHKVVNLKLFSNFLRSYQVLPDRTHPHILTTGTGGYLLTGYLVAE